MDPADEIAFTRRTRPPRMAVPAGAVDCHHHVYDGAWPVVPGGRVHGEATLEDHTALMGWLGVARRVLVQPSSYGVDNALHLAALRRLGPERARMVAVVRADTPLHELRSMAGDGVVGARVNLVQGIPLGPTDVAPLGRVLAELGWHLQIFASADAIAALGPVLRSLPCPVVFDHFCQLPLVDWASHPAWGVVMDLTQAGRAWVKLSSPYSLDQARPERVGPLARALVAAAPERLVWGTNWPHPNAEAMPDDAALLDGLADWARDEGQLRAILVGNAEALYGFSPWPAAPAAAP